MVTFQNGLLVTAVLFTVLAVLSLLFWQEFWRDYGVILMLAAVTAGVIGFTALDHEQEK